MAADKISSYGRGGAGNFSAAKDIPPPDLVTPTIKGDMYTTGRGGQGNMAKNYSDRPELARERQDVNAMPRRLSEAETFYGRGGAANTTRPSQEDVLRAREENRRMEQQARQSSRDRAKGLADKGRDMLKRGLNGEDK
ncbi:MAG: hypothetical protein FRX48_04029 [Lasallia pustulata]|uniref:Uncharacterized protein n=1 Tax=Lasallia pustulata TaxID=136370 RepID=A0A5M8PQR8_9LECA|nr:MAG: hypothetical protein FRX48_04029 [Lasallia pustulata]